MSVGVIPGAHLSETFSKLDFARVNRSRNIIKNQQRKFTKKQRRGNRVKSQVEEHGPGYETCKYPGAQPDINSDAEDATPTPTSSTAHLTDPDSDVEPDPLTPTTSLAVEVADCCDICG